MGKPKSPPSPDFPQVAIQQGQENLAAARASGRMSNPNIITPYGSQTVTWGQGGPGTPGTPGHWNYPDYLQGITDAERQNQARPLNYWDSAKQQIVWPDWQEATPGTSGSPGDPDQATITQTLTPAGEQTVKEQQNAELNLARFANNTAMPMLQNVLSTPFSFRGTPQQTLPSAGNIALGPNASSFNNVYGADYGQVQGAPNLQGMGSAQGYTGNAQAISGLQAPNLQTSLNTNGMVPSTGAYDESQVARMPVNAGTTAQQAIMSRLNPDIARQRTSTETQLINQGLRPGGEAYNNAIELLGRQENDQRTQAALQGLNLDFGANQQGFGQAQARGQFQNQANQQQFGQRVQSGEFGNQAQLASFGAGLQNIEQINRATGQNFGQGLAATESQNQALGQNQQVALAQQDAANRAQAQGFANAQTMQGAQNAATQQNFQNQTTSQQAQNAAQQQQYIQLLQSAQFGNAAQQQALAQLLQQRQIPLNEVSALLSGSQIQNPQFQAFQGQTVAPTPVFQGAQSQAGWDQNLYAQQVAQRNAMVGGLFQLGGAATSMVKPFSFCWIARAIYGVDDPRVSIVRAYLLGPFSKHRFGRFVVSLYRRYGERVAQSPKACALLRPLFDIAVKQGGDAK